MLIDDLSTAKRATADAIYDVLVAQAGGHDSESWRLQFARFYANRKELREFRFGGLLGFGGKIWWTSYRGWYVSGNRSDQEAVVIIERSNAALEHFNTKRQRSHKS